jgi:transcription elongation factor Elf1
MNIRINDDIVLPDIAQVLDNQFYCPVCSTKMRGVDPRGALETFKNPKLKREFIELNGEEAFNEFTSILRRISSQMRKRVPMDSFVLQCIQCDKKVVVKANNLAQFLMEKTIANEWSENSRITLLSKKLQFLK